MNLEKYSGMDVTTGRDCSGAAHLAQSLADILTTPRGALVMKRDYGCDLWKYIGAPNNPQTTMEIIHDAAQAIARWEPRVNLRRVLVTRADAGGILEIELHFHNHAAIRIPGDMVQ